MYRTVLQGVWVALIAFGLAIPAQASLIQNGNFESVSGGQFTGWTYGVAGAANVENGSVISGTYSAELVVGSGNPNYYLQQAPTQSLSSFIFECDFAVFPNPSNRSMNILLYYGPDIYSQMINMRVGPNNVLQAYDGSAWQSIGSLSALTTTDTGAPGVWDGENPVVNHLRIEGYLAPTNSFYHVTLNGTTVPNVTYFQTAPNSQYYTIHTVRLQGISSNTNWLADNVVFRAVPEPSAGMLLGLGGLFGLAGLLWRRHRPASPPSCSVSPPSSKETIHS